MQKNNSNPLEHNKKRIYLREFDDSEQELERISTNSFFEVEICNEGEEHSGILTWLNSDTKQPTRFRLRHLNSGKLVTSYSKLKGGIIPEIRLTLDTFDIEQPDETQSSTEMLKHTQFTIQNTTISTDEMVKENSVVRLQHHASKCFVSTALK